MKLFFHLGYTRTGTTFLQKYIFPKHRDINYLGAKNFYDSNQVKISQYKLDLLANLYTKLELDI